MEFIPNVNLLTVRHSSFSSHTAQQDDKQDRFTQLRGPPADRSLCLSESGLSSSETIWDLQSYDTDISRQELRPQSL